ncbi:hypothetical protein BC830DRAFT_790938 [Chytriomyces sp. MP71]|nr:hypothetical protein BC830DRAFT_790938 [Chytriomyces sp. MP71]
MHECPSEHILCGAYIMENFYPTLIKNMISLLKSDRLRAMLLAANTETFGLANSPMVRHRIQG